MRLACMTVLFARLAASAALGDDWPQFRGPGGDGVANVAGLPLSWSERENICWKTAIPGRGWSSPVVLGDRVWMTTAIETAATQEEREQRVAGRKYASSLGVAKTVSLRLIGADRRTGALVHNIEVFHVENPEPIDVQNSYASPTPAAEPGRVYCDFGTYGTAGIDAATGAVLWKRRLPLDHQVGPGSSPILFKNLLVLVRDGCDAQYVAALDKQTGATVWKTDRPPIDLDDEFKKGFCSPLLVKDGKVLQLVVPGAKWVAAYEPETGKPIWRVDYGKGFSNVPTPVFGHGMVYVGTDVPGNQLWAIRVDGHGDVTDSHVAWKATKQMPKKCSPLLAGSELYTVSDNGIASCLDARTGEVLWTERIGGNYAASPVFADGRVYFLGGDGKTTVIRAGRKFEKLAENQLSGRVVASPAIAGHAIFLRTDSHLYRIEKKGRPMISYQVPRLRAAMTIDANWDKSPWKNITSVSLDHYMGQKPAHRPNTRVKMAYDDEAVYVIFRVEDRYVRARATEHQKGVCQDSCVEFFFTPGPDVAAGYFYLEMNCGGTMLFRFNGPKKVVEFQKEQYGAMSIAHSLPKTVDPEIRDPLTWTLEYRLPLALLKKACPTALPGPGVSWRANFYKCADDSSHPHWLTWSPVDNPTPQFHLPKFFGVLNFE